MQNCPTKRFCLASTGHISATSLATAHLFWWFQYCKSVSSPQLPPIKQKLLTSSHALYWCIDEYVTLLLRQCLSNWARPATGGGHGCWANLKLHDCGSRGYINKKKFFWCKQICFTNLNLLFHLHVINDWYKKQLLLDSRALNFSACKRRHDRKGLTTTVLLR